MSTSYDFIGRHTRLQMPPLIPELRLHLADDIASLWHLTQIERDRVELPPPYWAFAWIGGQAVARFVLDHPVDVLNRRVLDFGGGSGLCAIAALKAGAAHALTADVDPYCRAAVELNSRANGVRVEFTARDLLTQPPPAFDVVLAGDVCYERRMAGRVLNWLETAHRAGTRVLVGDPVRPYFPEGAMVRLCEYPVPAPLDLEDRDIKLAGVFTFPG